MAMSRKAANRIQRSLAQAIIGGALTAVPAAILDGWRGAVIAVGGALSSFAMAWAQNTLEDADALKDRRI
jgi:uncharacterized membrane protein